MTGRTSDRGAVRHLCESLEERRLLAVSADFVGVGMAWQNTSGGPLFTPYILEGTIGANDAASGTFWRSGTNGRVSDGGLGFSYITRLNDGRYLRPDGDGVLDDDYDETNGAQFLLRDGYPVGWWLGEYDDVRGEESEILLQRAAPGVDPEDDLDGSWRFSMFAVNGATGVSANISGTLVIDTDRDRIDWGDGVGATPRTRSTIDDISSRGLIVTNEGEYFYLSADGSTLVFADMRTSDNVVYVGIAVRAMTEAQPGDVTGGYLLNWTLGENASPSDGPSFLQRYVAIEDDGDYKIYDLDEYDDGKRDELERGYWRISGSTLILERGTSSGGDLAYSFRISRSGGTLIGYAIQSGSQTTAVLGIATRDASSLPPAPEPVIAIPSLDALGRPVVFSSRTDQAWYVADAVARSGGPVPTGDLEAWVDPKDGRAYAAAVTAQGLVLYSERSNGVWTYRTLRSEIGTTADITRALTHAITPSGQVNVFGLNDAGDFIRYFQDGRTNDAGEFLWAASNVTELRLTPLGVTTPAYTGELEAYVTPWGGLNVAGLDEGGRIWTVWWAPGAGRWYVSNLSAISKTAPLSGDLTVMVSPWNGINITGVNAAGHLVTTWWAPGLGGAWKKNNLTLNINGPEVERSTITSFYIGASQGLNIVALDADTGDVMLFWWNTSRTGLGWTYTNLSVAVGGGVGARITEELAGLEASDGSINVFGRNAGGQTLRYFVNAVPTGTWQAQNLTSIAIVE